MKSLALPRAVAVLLALSAVPAAAQRVDSPYRFVERGQAAGVFAGYLSPSRGPIGLGPDAAAAVGARYGISVSGPFMVEVELLFSPTARPVVDTAFTSDSARVVVGEADMSLLVAQGSIRFNVTGGRTWHRLQPFAVVGVGMATDVGASSPADTLVAADARADFGSSFAGQLGLGVELHLSPRWSARLDARNIFWKLKNPAAFRLQDNEVVLPADQWENNGFLAAGFSIRF